MHTEFLISSESGGRKLTNKVTASYPTAFGKGVNLFDGMTVFYAAGGMSLSRTVACEHLSTTYIGNGEVCFTFRSIFDAGNGALIKKICFKAGDGQLINTAETESAIDCVGETCIFAKAYAQINGNAVLSDSPEAFFERLFGLKGSELQACVCDSLSSQFNEATAVSVSEETSSGRQIISATVKKAMDGKYVVFFCDKRPVFAIEADLVSAESGEAEVVGQTIYGGVYGVEITDLAGSADTLSILAERRIGHTLGSAVDVFLPFKFSAGDVKHSPSGNTVAVKTANGIFLLKKNGGLKPVGRLLKETMGGKVKDFALSEGRLFVLADTLLCYDSATGNLLHNYAYTVTCSGVFAVDNETVILTDVNGFYVFSATSELTQVSSESIADVRFCFDGHTSVMTSVTAERIVQYKFSGTGYTSQPYVLGVDLSSFDAVAARQGVFVMLSKGVLTVVYLYTGEAYTHYLPNAQIILCEGGHFITANGSGECALYQIKGADLKRVTTLESPAVAFPLGVLCEDAVFYPFALCETVFELGGDLSASGIILYSETPYFAKDSINLTMEALYGV